MTIRNSYVGAAQTNCDNVLGSGDFKMNQTCKVCGEPAAGFHFGAFTCEGCKSFFGRSYNNINSINDCKNNNKCVINKKNRTACKACRLRKCVLVGMSKSGSRYGRRSNWFKIHCLLQEQQQKQMQESGEDQNGSELMPPQMTPPPNGHHPQMGMRMMNSNHFSPSLLHHMSNIPRTREELMLLGLEEGFRHSASPSVSSPESHNSDSSVEIPDVRRIPYIPGLLPPTFLPPPGLLFPPGYPPFYPGLLQPAPPLNHPNTNNNNNEKLARNNNPVETKVKREYLDAVLQLQRQTTTHQEDPDDEDEEVDVKTPVPTPSLSPIQDTPIDLSMRTISERGSSPARSEITSDRGHGSEGDEESDCDLEANGLKRVQLISPAPLNLTTKA